MSASVLSTARGDVHRAITNRVLAAMESASEFYMPWHNRDGPVTTPTNAFTGFPYRGVNAVALWAQARLAGYRSGYWATYDQWRRLGAQVQFRQRASLAVRYAPADLPEPANDEPDVRGYGVAWDTKVFNQRQVRGWEPPRDDHYALGHDHALQMADAYLSDRRVVFRVGSDVAAWVEDDDHIEIPRRDLVADDLRGVTEDYYVPIFHALIHWTGARWRLNRSVCGLTPVQASALEILVQEIGAAYLCAEAEIANPPRADRAEFIPQWLELLRTEPRLLFEAAHQAGRAAAYLGSTLFALK